MVISMRLIDADRLLMALDLLNKEFNVDLFKYDELVKHINGMSFEAEITNQNV